MKVHELMDKLKQLDPEMVVLMHCCEEASRVGSVVRNGDALYFAAGNGEHEGLMSYVYLSDRSTCWLDAEADEVM